MSLVITPNSKQALSAKHQLQLLALPNNKRIRLLKTLGRYERKLARQRVRTQTTVKGNKFAARESGKKTKMLKRMGKTLEPYVKAGKRLELKHKNALTGRIAALHQEGGTEQMTANRMARIHGKPNYKAPCTRSQAKALSAEGYKVRRAKGKGYRRATIKEITANLNHGKATLVLSKLRGQKSRKSWPIAVKARPFLGDTPQNVQAQLAQILNQLNKRG
ncbi:hypothetical protein PTRA_a1570 [Pseudoalteromonas translucida KMM 520]|uniref:Phage virion morphogenesis protein n=1 Tax=Pseudoalteromonas translucida KMM 520 TaxID=1315283 RepID=A0A0U2V4M2_9GAMM|nr:hypothetical protein [Pseudoalteromonas translucida]ALS32764.1 hypothetical protein PTRA_a1570 [Pseudoalteromonas translucida KMM 520]